MSFNGKAIYNPAGKAGEYAEWACNFYAGCSNGCEYCYLTKGWSAKTYEHRYPKLKAGFKDEEHALEVFEKELFKNIDELRQHGLFFSFTTDPMLSETIYLTLRSIAIALRHDVPVKVLTKRADFVDFAIFNPVLLLEAEYKQRIAFGFTLTGHDELEQGASTNAERIDAMRQLHEAGFKTFASIEPIIDLDSSFRMICRAFDYCGLFKIGLESGKRYNKKELIDFMSAVTALNIDGGHLAIYFKDTLLTHAGIDRNELPKNCVERDYNLFNDK